MFEREAKLEIVPISGTLRVSVKPQPNLILTLLEITVGLFFTAVAIKQWSTLSWLMRTLFVWGDVSTIVALCIRYPGQKRSSSLPRK
jgi:hypothetical protein